MTKGVKRTDITDEKVRAAAMMGCTYDEMALIFAVDRSVLTKRFSGVIKEGHGQMKERLRRAQLKVALEGNPTMLIWLGKQMLKQADSKQIEVSGKDGNPIETSLKVEFVGD